MGKIGEKNRHGSWQKSETKKEMIEEVRNKGRKIHFASLMDLCHLKNSKLEPQFQKYKGRVVLRSDIVKDDSGSYAVFTEQGSSAAQMTAATVMDIISRLSGCAGPAVRRSICLLPGQNGRCTNVIESSQIGMSSHFDTSTETQMDKIMVQYGRPGRPLEWNLQGHPLAGLWWKRQLEKGLLKYDWEKVPNRECLFVNREKKTILICVCGRYQTDWEKAEH